MRPRATTAVKPRKKNWYFGRGTFESLCIRVLQISPTLLAKILTEMLLGFIFLLFHLYSNYLNPALQQPELTYTNKTVM
jgi:hypothetical protein